MVSYLSFYEVKMIVHLSNKARLNHREIGSVAYSGANLRESNVNLEVVYYVEWQYCTSQDIV